MRPGVLFQDLEVVLHDIDCPVIVAPWHPAPATTAERRELEYSLERVGQLDNLLVVRTARCRYALIAGRRRYEAARALSWDFISCKVVSDAYEAAMPSDARLHALAYNRLAHRRHLAPDERAAARDRLDAAEVAGQLVPLGGKRENAFGVLYRDVVVPIGSVYAPPTDALWRRESLSTADLTDLAHSLEAVGQLDNLLVVAAAEDRYRLVAGRGRWEAMRQLGWEYCSVKIICDARDAPMPPAHQLHAIAESARVHRRHLDSPSFLAARDLARRAVELAHQLEDRTEATPTLVPLAPRPRPDAATPAPRAAPTDDGTEDAM